MTILNFNILTGDVTLPPWLTWVVLVWMVIEFVRILIVTFTKD